MLQPLQQQLQQLLFRQFVQLLFLIMRPILRQLKLHLQPLLQLFLHLPPPVQPKLQLLLQPPKLQPQLVRQPQLQLFVQPPQLQLSVLLRL